MSKSKKILNYAAMACAIISAIIFFIDQDWNAALWALIAFMWMADYSLSLIEHHKELKDLKDEIESLKKGE